MIEDEELVEGEEVELVGWEGTGGRAEEAERDNAEELEGRVYDRDVKGLVDRVLERFSAECKTSGTTGGFWSFLRGVCTSAFWRVGRAVR